MCGHKGCDKLGNLDLAATLKPRVEAHEGWAGRFQGGAKRWMARFRAGM